jgi:ankyrin repeat protein
MPTPRALRNAVKRGDAKKVTALLADGADVHDVDLAGRSALTWAATQGYQPVVAVVLKHGADVDLDDHRSFFTKGKKFRQPAYLATSFSVSVANVFISRSGMPSKVRWTIRIDPDHKCKHVNLVDKSNIQGEQEYLFVPYSAFTVLSVAWKAGTTAELHEIELLAAVDNRQEPEDLPLAPWS